MSARVFDSKEFVGALPRRPGVYRMYDAAHEILYVGKAQEPEGPGRHVFRRGNVNPKVQALVQQIAAIEVTVAELRDRGAAARIQPDQGAPAALQRRAARRQELSLHPGLQRRTNSRVWRSIAAHARRRAAISVRFPSAGAVQDTLRQLQKLFRIRNCRDSFFANRSRPCLQHQIGRCSAPCVGLVDA